MEWVPCRSLPGDERRWYTFLVVSIAMPFVITLPVIVCRLLKSWSNSTSSSQPPEPKKNVGCTRKICLLCAQIVSDTTVFGQLLKLLGVVLAMGSLIVYWRDTTSACLDVEICQEWSHNVWWQVDLAINCYFLVYYALRFIAAQYKLRFIFDIYSAVDYFTIPPAFVAVGLDRNWHGLRFMRIINLLWVADLLYRVGVIKTITEIQFTRLIIHICLAVITGAGTFLLFECSGDPWNHDRSSLLNVTYWDYAYFSVVTIATLGYGDVVTTTHFGRLFCSLYIFACLFFIASFIATAAQLLPKPRRHPQLVDSLYFNHIIVCGNVTYRSALRFLETFYQHFRDKDSNVDITRVIFLHLGDPDDEMVLLLNEYQACVAYVRGSPLRDADLERARASVASSCIVLADQRAVDRSAEDATIILQVVAIKNCFPTLRVQVQVMLTSTLAFLKHYPAISGNRGDVVTCQSNIEAGLLGMSSLVPGFSTLFCNLIAAHPTCPTNHSIPALYARGCGMRFTCAKFSPTFYGMTFPDVAEICFVKLDVLLVGVYFKGQRDIEFHNLIPNPTAACIIADNMVGLIIASSDAKGQIVGIYCNNCHTDITEPEEVGICSCYSGAGGVEIPLHLASSNGSITTGTKEKIAPDPLSLHLHAFNTADESNNGNIAKTAPLLDSTGLYHWCLPDDLSSVLLTPTEAHCRGFSQHVIIFLLTSSKAATFSLQIMLMPMRASHIPFEELREIVIVGTEKDLKQDWPLIRTFPKVSLIAGDPTGTPVISASHIETCHSCVVLHRNDLNTELELDLRDKDAIVMSLRLRGMDLHRRTQLKQQVAQRYLSGTDVPIITVLDSEKSVRYLSQQPDTVDYRFTWPYMSGAVLVCSALESLMIPAYFNPSVIKLFSCLVFGGSSKELERIAAEGIGLRQPYEEMDGSKPAQLKTTMKLIDMESAPLSPYVGRKYSELFLFLLRDYGLLCIGLYRCAKGIGDVWGRALTIQRYVATHPPGNTILDLSDRLYVLLPAVTA